MLSFKSDLKKVFNTPLAYTALVMAILFVLGSNFTRNLGTIALHYKHIATSSFIVFVLIFFGQRTANLDSEQVKLFAIKTLKKLPFFVIFAVLIGFGRLVSHGTGYAAMAQNFWDFDPLAALAKRIILPALSHTLGLEGPAGYTVFWYTVYFTSFCFAWTFLTRSQFSLLEKFSILSSSIFAYLLIAPGYSEVLVFICGLYALMNKTTSPEKVILAALMLGAHEVGAFMTALILIVKSEDAERSEWMAIFSILFAAYFISYTVNCKLSLASAFNAAMYPNPDGAKNSFQFLAERPLIGLLAVGAAYKLYWIPILSQLKEKQVTKKLMALCVLVSIPLVCIASDASRLIQFTSLAFFLVLADVLPTWSTKKRQWFAIINLIIPSIYVGTNCNPLWGKGLYSIYLRAGHYMGYDLGSVFH